MKNNKVFDINQALEDLKSGPPLTSKGGLLNFFSHRVVALQTELNSSRLFRTHTNFRELI